MFTGISDDKLDTTIELGLATGRVWQMPSEKVDSLLCI